MVTFICQYRSFEPLPPWVFIHCAFAPVFVLPVSQCCTVWPARIYIHYMVFPLFFFLPLFLPGILFIIIHSFIHSCRTIPYQTNYSTIQRSIYPAIHSYIHSSVVHSGKFFDSMWQITKCILHVYIGHTHTHHTQ